MATAKKKISANDWRVKTLSQVRTLIKQAEPKVIEEIKWRKPSNPAGVPTWSHDGMILTGETYTAHLRLNFVKGGVLREANKDFKKMFNAYRAILVHEGDKINGVIFKKLIRAAVALNQSGKAKKKIKK